MMHFLAILVMIVGLAAAFLSYIGTLTYGSFTIWAVVGVAGVLATFATRRPAN